MNISKPIYHLVWMGPWVMAMDGGDVGITTIRIDGGFCTPESKANRKIDTNKPFISGLFSSSLPSSHRAIMLAIDSLSKDDAPSYVSAFTINRMWYKSAEPQCSWPPVWHKPWPQIRRSRWWVGRPQTSFHERHSLPAVKYRLLLQSDQRMGLIPLNIMIEHKKRSTESLIEWRD